MTTEQLLLFGLFAGILILLVWGRFRHDLVAAGGLLLGVVLGLVPQEDAFSGFSNPAVVIVALVLIASRAFENSGALGVITRKAVDGKRSVGAHIAIAGGLAAALSAVINNVAALALLMPMDVEAARRAGRPPGITLMPLAFATILGGMVTLIGTPPNIIASTIRNEQLGEPYGMFDFTPVGLTVAIAGVLFIALAGWRLVPRRKDRAAELVSQSSFEAELLVHEGAPAVGKLLDDFEEEARNADVLLLGIVRKGRRQYRRRRLIEASDQLVVKGSTEAIAAFIKATGLQEAPVETPKSEPASKAAIEEGTSGEIGEDEAIASGGAKRPEIVEAVVRVDSPLVGRSAASFDLRQTFGIALLGIARAGSVSREEVRRRTIHAGDVLLLTGRGARSQGMLNSFGLIAVDRVSVAPFRPRQAALVAGLFGAAILAATLGWLSFTVAIAIAVAAYGALGIVPPRDFYSHIEWPVVVMLACLLPIGEAFDRVGGTALVADAIVGMTQGAAPVFALVLTMVATMILSDVLNNVATMVITGPIAIDLAKRLDVNPDTFLMGVAIAASCAFLTPIGHKNNTLIMGPGGFRFSDYWRMGLPLEAVVLAVSAPMLLLVWPLQPSA
jgi:di/tricarboxylate transporter